MSTETLRPNAAGSLTNIALQYPASTYHWDKVDETTADGSGTYLYETNTTIQYDLFNLSAPTLSDSAAINSVTIYAVCRRGVSSPYSIKAQIVTRTNGSTYYGTLTPLYATDWSEVLSKEYISNPHTGSAWTKSELTDLQAGIGLRGYGGGQNAECTQVYVVVDYTPGYTVSSSVIIGVSPSASRLASLTRNSALSIGILAAASGARGFGGRASVIIGALATATKSLAFSRASSIAIGIKATASALQTVIRRCKSLTLKARSLILTLIKRGEE